MAETLLSFGVQKLWDLLVRESDRFEGVDEQLTELKSDLNLLRSFLKDANAKKYASALVRNCVEEIKEIVFDTEDIIETFLLKEELRKTRDIKKHMRRLSCIIVDHKEIASEMRGISKRISKVIRDMQSFGVQQFIVGSGEYSHPLEERQREIRKTFPSNYENDLVGLEENVEKLVGYLVGADNIQVVSITGMGGIGKTTLARQVFNHKMVKIHFDGAVWVCISQQFTRKNVWETILQRLSSKHIDEHRESYMTEEELQDKLFRLLETSKPLIVLDDMWKEEDWDRIKSVFPPTKGWKVLVTSRNEGVALHADPTCVTFKPECLTLEESWTLFQRIAFPKKDTTEFKVDEEMEEMGEKMIKHCGGLPLAIKVLGGLLASQFTLREWKMVYENIGTNIVGRTSLNGDINSWFYYVLSLSFEELPSHLKHCFLYLAHFPEDYPIDVEKLSYYWATEGVSKPRFNDGATVRDVAEGYIEELAKRNMVIAERDRTTSRFETCQLHDMMREVCLVKAGEEKFLEIIDAPTYTSTANYPSPYKSRRLVIRWLDETFDLENPKLRSFLFILHHGTHCWSPSSLCFRRLRLIRVLDLYKAQFKGGKLPSNIGKLIHLKYLSLYQARVSHLPSSMRNLKLLLYLNLNVEAGSPLYVPNVLKEMSELKYLWLPDEIHDKVNLELADLINLETLENFSTKQSSVRDLHHMTRLAALSILFNGGGTMEALSSSLGKLRYLENLTIHDYRANNCVDDAEGFVLDCNHLNKLELQIYMPKLPDGKHFPSLLTTITLSGCRLEEDPMRMLEKLLHLNEVLLGDRSFGGKKMVCSRSGFPRLQKLVLFGQLELEEWIVEEGSMPLLETLDIGRCQKLKELPDGLRCITSLKKLRTQFMTSKWIDKLSKGGEDYYKVQHIRYVLFL